MEKIASRLSGVPGASPVPRCWVVGLEAGAGWGRSSGLVHAVTAKTRHPFSICSLQVLQLSAACLLWLGCGSPWQGCLWSCLPGHGHFLWDFLSLVVTIFQSQTQILSAPGVCDLSFLPLYSHLWTYLSSVGMTQILFFHLPHNAPPQGFPKEEGAFGARSKITFKLYLFSPLLRPSPKAMRLEPTVMERSPTERKRKKSTFQNIIWPYILVVCRSYFP